MKKAPLLLPVPNSTNPAMSVRFSIPKRKSLGEAVEPSRILQCSLDGAEKI